MFRSNCSRKGTNLFRILLEMRLHCLRLRTKWRNLRPQFSEIAALNVPQNSASLALSLMLCFFLFPLFKMRQCPV
uniref:Uncharacterized protein n=1 Tax=Meloidogyne incognita TaxID=6306 RepID=A0A914NBL4_MELIC